MSETLVLSAEARDRAGKGASRAHRREGRVPAVIYGGKEDPITIHLEEKGLMKQLQTGHFMNSLAMIEVGGKQTRTLPKDVQFHPVSDRPLHVDFLRIAKGARVTVAVPVRFHDEEESPGLERGGVLNVVRHDLEVSCDATKIPDDIMVSLAGLDIGGSIHLSAISLPEGVEAVGAEGDDFTIATLVAPSALKAEEDEAAEAEAAAAEAEGEAPGENEAEGGEPAEPGEGSGDGDKGE